MKIGIDKDSDIVINHPDLVDRSIVLGPDSQDEKYKNRKGFKLPDFIPIYHYKTVGLTVYLIRLQILLITILVTAAGLYYSNIFPAVHTTLTTSQDWTPIDLPARNSYGFCRQDKKHSEGVRFSFNAEEKVLYRLSFYIGSSVSEASVTFTLNGALINEPLPLPQGWSHQIFLPLPSEHITNGKNTIEVRPDRPGTSQFYWGISEVSIIRAGRSGVTTNEINEQSLKVVLNALKRKDISGEELGLYYTMVNKWDPSTPVVDVSLSKKALLTKIEHKMESALYQAVFEVRSKEIQDDHAAAKKLLISIERWIPRSWEKGWRIYDQLHR